MPPPTWALTSCWTCTTRCATTHDPTRRSSSFASSQRKRWAGPGGVWWCVIPVHACERGGGFAGPASKCTAHKTNNQQCTVVMVTHVGDAAAGSSCGRRQSSLWPPALYPLPFTPGTVCCCRWCAAALVWCPSLADGCRVVRALRGTAQPLQQPCQSLSCSASVTVAGCATRAPTSQQKPASQTRAPPSPGRSAQVGAALGGNCLATDLQGWGKGHTGQHMQHQEERAAFHAASSAQQRRPCAAPPAGSSAQVGAAGGSRSCVAASRQV